MIDDVGAVVDRWAERFSGFIFCADRKPPWVAVQEMAKVYSFSEDRHGEKREQWEASARRFIEVVNTSDRWCLDPGEVAMMEHAMPPDERPLPPPYVKPEVVQKPKRKRKVKS